MTGAPSSIFLPGGSLRRRARVGGEEGRRVSEEPRRPSPALFHGEPVPLRRRAARLLPYLRGEVTQSGGGGGCGCMRRTARGALPADCVSLGRAVSMDGKDGKDTYPFLSFRPI